MNVKDYESLRQKRQYINAHPSMMNDILKIKNATLRRFCATALDLAHIATGRLDASIDKGFENWDIAAGWLLVEEGGGKISRISGEPISLTPGKKLDLVAAVSPKLHQQLVDLANPQKQNA